MGDRWYDAQLGRWISADTIVPEPGNPQSLNRYSYVYNNPLKFVDPSGHSGYPPGCEHSQQCMDWWDKASLVGFVGKDWNVEQKTQVIEGAWAVAQGFERTAREQQTKVKQIPIEQRRYVPESFSLSSLWGLSARETFHEVYGEGPVTFVEAPQCAQAGCGNGVDPGAWAWSRIGDMGEVWVNENVFTDPGYAGFAIAQNAVHELMHGLDQLGGGAAGNNLAAAWAARPDLTRGAGGFAAGTGWQQSAERTGSEVFADMGLGWTYDRWGSNRAGIAKKQYMKTNMPWGIALAVASN
jgi:hypothetical protein